MTMPLCRLPLQLLLIASFAAAQPPAAVAPDAAAAQAPVPQPVAPVAVGPHENLNAILWVQRSAEYRAITYQIFQSARRNLLDALADKQWTAAIEQDNAFAELPPAIVLDLDETVLDNSNYQAQLLQKNAHYTEGSWQQWVESERALAIPGAAEFLNFAHSKGVTAIYITNRICDSASSADHTLTLLKTLQYPVKAGQLLCRANEQDTNDKSPRRAKVASSYRIVLLLGDDLNDFVTVPAVSGEAKARLDVRDRITEAHRMDWGVRWFMLPNPTYGSWERAIGASIEEKREGLR